MMTEEQLTDRICLTCVDARHAATDESAQKFINDIRGLAEQLAALTQPASPALNLPDAVIPDEHLIRNVRSSSVAARNEGKIEGWNLCFSEFVRINVPHTAPIEPICATGRTMPPHEFSQMVNELRDVDNTQSKRAKIVGVLHSFNIRPRKPE